MRQTALRKIEPQRLETTVNHQQASGIHCIGCWIVVHDMQGLRVECNECGYQLDFDGWLSKETP